MSEQIDNVDKTDTIDDFFETLSNHELVALAQDAMKIRDHEFAAKIRKILANRKTDV